MSISYDKRTLRSISNSETGEVGSETTFHYHQEGDVVWAEYSGGEIVRGMVLAIRITSHESEPFALAKPHT